ncbi:LPS assembly protein LptD [Candidatus Erwinia haradaeae]|uniref:LPS-assembly protein LptD n=1 Tax=Candidatus Erwinia haradaeae TaxID=1922217 RepID=A0A451D4V5_9GAMM|nr:LPS assembly protein LptD [Candidatus Erwinia haradaeae]VFP80723.1 LPS-assembly protein LptD [Candidatus Erwinia haradaeae]
MNIRLFVLLIALLALVFASKKTLANNLITEPIIKDYQDDHLFIQKKRIDQLPVVIHSDTAQGTYPDEVIFSGHVDIQQGRRHIKSEKVQVNRSVSKGTESPIHTVLALGKVCYYDNKIMLKGSRAWSNLNTKDTNIWAGNYQMIGRQGRGIADQIQLRNSHRYTILKNGTFTSCPIGQDSWHIAGSKIIYDHDEQLAEVWGARFKLGSIPIFYSPYFQIPVGNKSRSGFLTPRAYYNKNGGFQYSLPYYWKIAPGADATLIAHYISRRGVQWKNEFRYLIGGSGTIEFDYLNHDLVYQKEHITSGRSFNRWLFHWQNSSVYLENWRFKADYTKVSDPYYFSDLDSIYGMTSDDYMTQKLSFGYTEHNWNTMVSIKKFQSLSVKDQQNTYSAEPQFDLNYYYRHFYPLYGHLYAQISRFVNVNSHMPSAMRFHLEPDIKWSRVNEWNAIHVSAKLFATHYEQYNVQYYNFKKQHAVKLQNSVNRILPQLKIDGSMRFERNMNWFTGYRQMIEPRAQYLYIPYCDQSSIQAYDSTLLRRDYDGLFRESTHSGLDRITSANQIATGFIMHIINPNLLERFNFSVGQIYSFNAVHGHQDFLRNQARGSVVLASDSYWKITDNLAMRGGVQYDVHVDNISQGNTILEWCHDSRHVLQCSYRYTNAKYMKNILAHYSNQDRYDKGISQVGVIASWPIMNTWSLIGAFYYDLKTGSIADQLVGMQYTSCCYALRLGYERKINGLEQNQSQYDNKISFHIELRGMNSDHELDSSQMLSQGILPYQKII